MMKALYPGSFDPITKGHLDIIARSNAIVDHLTVAVLENPRKQSVFTIEERLEMLRRSTVQYPNVEVDYFLSLIHIWGLPGWQPPVIMNTKEDLYKARSTLPDFRQRVQTLIRRGVPSTSTFTLWIFGRHSRFDLI